MTFLVGDTASFFRPLTGKWRTVIGRCIQALHARLYDSRHQGQQPLSREELRDMFVMTMRETPHSASDIDQTAMEDLEDLDASDEYTLASSIIRCLVKTGWIEVDEDKAKMLQIYRFSRFGRIFADSLIEIDQPPLKTRQRNMRKTMHFLEAYLRDLEPYDLIDALNHAEHVVRDLADDIAELNERRQRLIREAISRPAIEDFLDYIQTKFVPDLSIRISADSAEKYREKIGDIANQIRLLPMARLVPAQEQLRRALQGQLELDSPQPILFAVLDRIERTVQNACNAKLPEIRAALQAYVIRSSLMIRQASSLLGGYGLHQLRQFLDKTARLSDVDKERCLEDIGMRMVLSEVRRTDPADMKPVSDRRPDFVSLFVDEQPPTREERLRAAIAQAESHAFSINLSELKKRLTPLLDEAGVLRLSNLSVTNADDMLAAVFALNALASIGQGKTKIHVKETGGSVVNRFFEIDDFEFLPRPSL